MPALNTIQKVAFRTSNRVFVGLPLCTQVPRPNFPVFLSLFNLGRNPDWMDFNIQNGLNIVNGGLFLQRFPAFLAPQVLLRFLHQHLS